MVATSVAAFLVVASLLLASAEAASSSSKRHPAFVLWQQQQQPQTVTSTMTKKRPVLLLWGSIRNSDPFASAMDPVDIDFERAKDCAEHFGKCSTDEMEHLRDGLHKERLQTMIFGGTNVTPEDAFQHHLLEEELNLQLSLLQDVTPPSTMFPTTHASVAVTTAAVPQEETTTPQDDQGMDEASDHSSSLPVTTMVGEKLLMVEEAIVEENLGDAIAICVVLGVLVAAPHLLQI